jgi:hypothetical protein
MTISDLGALGEFFGSILTLATLVYVAVQIRQNTFQQKREEILSVQHGQNTVVAPMQNPRVMGAYVRTATDHNPTIEDRGTCFSWVIQYINHYQVVHELHHKGGLDGDKYELWTGFAVAIVAPAGIRRWWDEESGKLAFHAEVRDEIDRRLRDSKNPPVPITEMWSHYSGAAWELVASERGA